MLVLSRKIGESLVIDGGIILKVLRVGGRQIHLGISAPCEIPIQRAELCPEPAMGPPCRDGRGSVRTEEVDDFETPIRKSR